MVLRGLSITTVLFRNGGPYRLVASRGNRVDADFAIIVEFSQLLESFGGFWARAMAIAVRERIGLTVMFFPRTNRTQRMTSGHSKMAFVSIFVANRECRVDLLASIM